MGRDSFNTMLDGISEKRARVERQKSQSGCLCLEPHDTDDWRMIFRLKGSVLPKSVLFSLPSAMAAVIIHIVVMQTDWFTDAESREALTDQKTEMWSSVMFVLGVLIVFRTNQAYSRYWEGATLLLQVRGEWFNAASSIISFCSSDPDRAQEVRRFQHQIVRFMSLLFCTGLQQVAFISDELLEIIDISGMDYEHLDFLSQCTDRSEVIVQWLQRSIILAMEEGVISAPAPVLSRVFQEVSRGSVIMQNVRKIAEIPFPFPYTQMIMVMLIVQTVLMPFVAAVTSATAWWAGILTFISVLAFWSLNYIAAEIEQPFGEDFNDLPIQNLMKDMNKSLRMLLLDYVLHPPEYEMLETDASCEVVNAADAGFGIGERRVVSGFVKRRRSLGTHSNTGTVVSVCSHVTSFAPDRVDFESMRQIHPRFDRGHSRNGLPGMATVISGAPFVDDHHHEEFGSFSWNVPAHRAMLQASCSSMSLRSNSRSHLDISALSGVDWCQDHEGQLAARPDGHPRSRSPNSLHIHPTERAQNRITGGRAGRVGADVIKKTTSSSTSFSFNASDPHHINHSHPAELPHHGINQHQHHHNSPPPSSRDVYGAPLHLNNGGHNQTQTIVFDSDSCFPTTKFGAAHPGGPVLQANC